MDGRTNVSNVVNLLRFSAIMDEESLDDIIAQIIADTWARSEQIASVVYRIRVLRIIQKRNTTARRTSSMIIDGTRIWKYGFCMIDERSIVI
jgi:hypothetical protein